jgi:hypothetical protein
LGGAFVYSGLGWRDVMADELNRRGINPTLAFLLGAAVVGLCVLAYLHYERQREVVKINVPGFSGEITKDKGVDIEIGKH